MERISWLWSVPAPVAGVFAAAALMAVAWADPSRAQTGRPYPPQRPGTGLPREAGPPPAARANGMPQLRSDERSRADAEIAAPHPLQVDNPGDDIVVCLAGCASTRQAIVFRATKSEWSRKADAEHGLRMAQAARASAGRSEAAPARPNAAAEVAARAPAAFEGRVAVPPAAGLQIAAAVTCLAGCGYRSLPLAMARPVESTPLPVVAKSTPPPVLDHAGIAAGTPNAERLDLASRSSGYRPQRSFRRR